MNTSLRRLVTLCAIAAMLAACGKKEHPDTAQNSITTRQDTAMATARPESTVPPAPYVFFNIDSLQAVLDAGKHKLDQALLDDPDKLKNYLNTLSGSDPTSIPYAIHFIKNYPAPAGSPIYDTLYKQFYSLHYLVSGAFSIVVSGAMCEAVLSRNQLERIGPGDPLPDDPELKNLLAYLNLYSLKVYVEEGAYFIDADPELFHNVFHRKASPQLLYYLTLLTKDQKERLTGDNMLLISYEQLYQRIEAWGLFITAHPHGDFLNEQAIRTYRSDLSILLQGLGNTPIFDTETQILNSEIKLLYETIMANDKDHVSKKIVTDYYNFLAKSDFKQTDEVRIFLNRYHIPSLFKQPV